MARDVTSLFISSLALLLCQRSSDAFVPIFRIGAAGDQRLLDDASSGHRRCCHRQGLLPPRRKQRSIPPRARRSLLPLSSSQQGANNPHGSSSGQTDKGGRKGDPHRPPPPPPADRPGPDSVVFRVLRGGRCNSLSDSSGGGSGGGGGSLEADLVEVSLDQSGGGGGLDNSAQNLREFLFLVRSSQPRSIGEELQRRGIRVFPEEAFVDVDGGAGAAGAGAESGVAWSAPATRPPPITTGRGGGGRGGGEGGEGGRAATASGEARDHDDDGLSLFSVEDGAPLPLDTSMAGLPRDEEGRARLVLWDPCGPEHPLVRAVGGEPSSEASIEVLNFLSPDGGGPRSAGEGEAGGERAAPGGGGFSRGYGDDFDESRSAVVFRKWFSLEQQQVLADALAAQIFGEVDDEGPRLAVDREHFPLLRDRAALAEVGDSMLSALSSERFSGEVGGRNPPVPTRANRDFNAVCYGAKAKMQEHKDTWKEWTLIVSIGSTIPFDLGTTQGSPDVSLELASGEGLLFNGYELFHEVHGVKEGTAPNFWKTHALSVKGGFARVGFLSMKSFNSKGVSAPEWGPERSDTGNAET